MIKKRYFTEFKLSTTLKRAFFTQWRSHFLRLKTFKQISIRREQRLKMKVVSFLKQKAFITRRKAEKGRMIVAYFRRRLIKRIF